MSCFVKQTKHEPNESDGFVWPAPTFEFFNRDGKKIEGQREIELRKWCSPQPKPWDNPPVFSQQIIDRKIQKSFTATEVYRKMEESNKRLDELTSKAADAMAKQIDDHILDAIMYGTGVMKVDPPKPLDSINIRTLEQSMKVYRPNLWGIKIPDA